MKEDDDIIIPFLCGWIEDLAARREGFPPPPQDRPEPRVETVIHEHDPGVMQRLRTLEWSVGIEPEQGVPGPDSEPLKYRLPGPDAPKHTSRGVVMKPPMTNRCFKALGAWMSRAVDLEDLLLQIWPHVSEDVPEHLVASYRKLVDDDNDEPEPDDDDDEGEET